MKANVNRENSSKKFKVTPEMLQNGELLSALILRFLNNRNKENMFTVLSCLRDSNVWLPATVTADGENLEVGEASENPIMFPAKQKIVIKPQVYKAKDEKLYVPIYSRRENVKSENLKGASLVNIPFEKCIEVLGGIEGCERFVLDPHIYNVVLDEDLVRIAQKLPSRLSTQNNEKK